MSESTDGLPLDAGGAETTCPVCGNDGYLSHVHPKRGVATRSLPNTGYLCFDYDKTALREIILAEQTPLRERDDLGLQESQLDALRIAVYYHPDE